MDKKRATSIVKKFVCSELLGDEKYQIKNSEPLISDGLIDSFSLARIGVFIEEEFNIYIPDKDLTVDKMDTINQIVNSIILKEKENSTEN